MKLRKARNARSAQSLVQRNNVIKLVFFKGLKNRWIIVLVWYVHDKEVVESG